MAVFWVDDSALRAAATFEFLVCRRLWHACLCVCVCVCVCVCTSPHLLISMYTLNVYPAGHRFTPTEVNYRANIFGMKVLGVEWIISVSAVGSLREEVGA